MEKSTKRYKPWQLIYYEAYQSEKDARERETKLKTHGNAVRELKKRIQRSFKNGEKGLPSTTFSLKSGAGFTLIELIIAIFILSVGISGVLGMFPLGIQVAKSSEMVTTGTQLGQAKIEEIIFKSYGEISTGEVVESPLPSPFGAYERKTKISYVDPTLNLQEVATDGGIKKIEVTVFWKSPLGVTEKSVKIATLISKR